MQNLNCRQKSIVQIIVEKQVYLRNGRGRRFHLSVHAIERFVERFNIQNYSDLDKAWKELASAFLKIGHKLEAEKCGGLKETADGVCFIVDDKNYNIKTLFKVV